MRLQKLFKDDDAVSPVIGVILMVAITVILAAVVASLVLGLGQDAGESPPTASFNVEYENNTGDEWTDPEGTDFDGNMTVTHESGEAIREDYLYFRGVDFNESDEGPSWQEMNQSAIANSIGTNGTKAKENATVAGDRAVIPANESYEVSVVWDGDNTDRSTTLVEDEGPAADQPN